MAIKVESTAFKEGGMIPARYGYRAENVSPQLHWSDIPKDARTIAVICDDPDAPGGDWVHWVIFNIPPSAEGLPENVPAQKTLPDGSRQGINDFGQIGYGGPCPPAGAHRYMFKVYALDAALGLAAGANKKDLQKAMDGHILSEGQLMGLYKR